MKKTIMFLILLTLNFTATGEESLIPSKKENFVSIYLDSLACFDDYKPRTLVIPDPQTGYTAEEFIKTTKEELGDNCQLANSLLLFGIIDDKTFHKVQLGIDIIKKSSEEKSTTGANIYLESSGGLIIEAMKIGDLIADNNMRVDIRLNGKCESACVFIYAAGISRSGGGNDGLGIHRPFTTEISTESLSFSEYLKEYEALTPIFKSYFSKYGVSPSLVDEMNAISSDEIRYLSIEEQNDLGIGFKNVAYEEFQKAREIKICGKEYHDDHESYSKLYSKCQLDNSKKIKDYKVRAAMCEVLLREDFPKINERRESCNKLKKLSEN